MGYNATAQDNTRSRDGGLHSAGWAKPSHISPVDRKEPAYVCSKRYPAKPWRVVAFSHRTLTPFGARKSEMPPTGRRLKDVAYAEKFDN